jgi:hypothetical protein
MYTRPPYATHIHPAFITWLNETIADLKLPLTKKQKYLETLTSMSGATIGAVSAYIMFILNEAFGDSVNARLGIENDKVKDMIRIFLGFSAFIPMAALGAVNVKDTFLNTVKRFTRKAVNDDNIIQNESYLMRFMRTVLVFASPFSSIPQSTLTWNNIADFNTRVGITCTAVIGPTFFNGRAGQNFIDKFKKKDHKIILLEKHLQACLQHISKMPATLLENLIASFFSENDAINTENVVSLFQCANNQMTVARSHSSYGRTTVSWTGFALGAIASIIYYELTITGEQDPLQIDSSWLQIIVAALSYLLNAALSSLATQLCFESIHDWFTNKAVSEEHITWPKLRKSFSVLAVFMGIFAAIPLGSLQIEAAQNASTLQTLLIFPTFLGPFCVRSRAFENILNRGLDTVKYFTTATSELEAKRQILLQIGQAIYKKLPFLSEEIKDQLYEIIKPPEIAELQTVAIDSQALPRPTT